MTEELYFVADAALIDRLGRELVGKQATALIELVKNSYDADATEVKVTLERSALVIDDNGTGMTRDELIAGFLRLASDLKVQEPRSRLHNRQRAGRKGIGRFATQRLGQKLRLQTWTDPDKTGLELKIDWLKFKAGQQLDRVPVLLSEVPPRHSGTILRIEKLRDNWTDAQIKRCWRGVLNLQQPFPVGVECAVREHYQAAIKQSQFFYMFNFLYKCLWVSEINRFPFAIAGIDLRYFTKRTFEWTAS